MKSSPYVYPTISFKNLKNKKIVNNFIKEKIVNFEYLKKIIKKIKSPHFEPCGRNKAEKIFSLFLDSNFRLGFKSLINKDKIFG